MGKSTKTTEQLHTITDINYSVIRFAWANEELKTWFITQTKKAFLPKGTRLLFKMGCEPTNEPLSVINTYPTTGDVINGIDGNKLKVINVEWY